MPRSFPPRPFPPRSGRAVGRRWRALHRLLAVAVALVVLAGCDASVGVDIEVEEDGSGIVRTEVILDGETAAGIIDLDTVGLALADLEAAGWATEAPERLDAGGLRLVASKPFGTPAQLEDVIGEIAGPDVLFRDLELQRTKAFARVDYALAGRIEPAPLDAFGDAELEASLGRSIADLAERYGATADDVTVRLRVTLPGDPRDPESTTGQELPGDDTTVRVWETTLAAAQPTVVDTRSATQSVVALAAAGVAIVAAVLAGLVLLGQILRILRPPKGRRRSQPAPRNRPRPDPVIPADDAIVEPEEGTTNPLVVALDGMGVIYREGDDIRELLVPFAREMGSDATEDEIRGRSRALSLGRITTGDFWRAIGVQGDAAELDEAYVARHQLNPGVIRFLRTLRDQGVQVACITNDATTWANMLRVKHSLDGLIDPWVMSGSVGVRKPDAPIFEVLRRITGQPPGLIMVVDDDLANLDAARDYGFRTAWFAPGATTADSNGHAVLRSFEVAAPAET